MFAARERGATVRVAEMPYPVRSADDIVEAFAAAMGPKTTLAVVDHVTESALVLPLASIAERCHARESLSWQMARTRPALSRSTSLHSASTGTWGIFTNGSGCRGAAGSSGLRLRGSRRFIRR